MQVIILAAGQSSRFWPLNQKHKSLIKIMGKPLILHTIEGLKRVGLKDIIIVQGPKKEIEKELSPFKELSRLNISYIVQPESKGTGNAVYLAGERVKGPFFVLWPYKVNIGEVVKDILGLAGKTKTKVVLTGTETNTPWDFGILEIKDNKVVRIIEKPKKGQEPSNIKILGVYFLQPDFFDYYKKVKKHGPEDFVDALNLYLQDKAAALIILKKEFPEMKYPWNLLKILEIKLKAKEFAGHLSSSAQIGKNVVLKGSVFIGENVIIGENTVINGPCFIGDNSKIGANCVFRGPVNLEKEVVVGSFAEIKNCLVQEGTHFHSGYWGDSIIGKNCRFGAGFITGNRRIDRQNIKTLVKGKKTDTGLTSLGAIIGDNVRVGIHSGTMPGVLIGSDCAIGPGSLVFKNLENETEFLTEFKAIKKKSGKNAI